MKIKIKKRIQAIFKSTGILLLLLLLFSFSKSESLKTTVENIFTLPQEIRPVPIQSSYTFAGEKIDTRHLDLRERMDRELIVNAYRHSATIQYIKLAHRYFPVIEPILKKNNVPDDFKYLAIAESGLRNVSSPAGAKGLWQFMEPIAEDLGLEVYDEVDERYHVEKSTQAACEYLNRLHQRFGSWINAAAAYNVGPTKFSRHLKDQYQDHFFGLNINEETMRYVFRIAAIKTIVENPENFGFQISDEEKYPPLNDFYTVRIDTSISNIGQFAAEYGITYRLLKIYNPWLRSHELTVKKNTYFIKIPKNGNPGILKN
jgi:membrane-bound lytic murein transglycosylase D